MDTEDGYYITFLLWLLLQTAHSQNVPSSSFHPLNSKSYGIAEGLPDRCVDYAFIDNLGKLNISPCQHAQLSYGQYIYQIDGHAPFLENIIVDSIDPNLIIQSLGMIGDSINFGRMIHSGDAHEGQWVSPYFYRFHPETGAFKYFQVKDDDGNPLSLDNVIYEAGQFIGCGTYRNKVHIFKILDDQVVLIDQVDLNREVEADRSSHPFVKYKSNYLWLLEDSIYQFDVLGNNGPGTSALEFTIRSNELNAVAKYGNEQLFVYASPGRIYLMDNDSGTFSSWYPHFLDFLPQLSYLFQDDLGNILFSFHKDENEYAAYLLDTNGQWHDYTDVIKAINPTPNHFVEHPLISADFTKYLFQTHYDFKIIEVRSSTGITAIPSSTLRGMVELEPGQIFASGNRIFSKHDPDWKLSSFNTCPIINHVRDVQIFKDEEGVIWENGLHYIIKHNQELCDTIDYRNRLVRMLPKGKDHFLVLDTQGELLLFSKRTEQFEYIATSIGEELNMQMLLDNENKCWLVANTIIQYIDLNDPASGFLHLEHPELNKNFISIDIDAKGRIWLGTFSNGLYVFDPSSDQLTNIDESNGLSNNSVATMLQDDDGDHWIGTFNGITIIDQHLNILGQVYEEDGLVNNECNRWSAIKLSNGDLGFGTIAGLSVIDPVQVKKDITNKPPNKIYLSSVTLPGDQIVLGSAFLGDLVSNGIRLPADRRNLKLSYGLSQYSIPDKSIYAYRLKGHQEDWNYVGGLHDLHLLDLPHGKYDLEINAWDYRGTSSENLLIIPLDVAYFFYQRAWFYLLCVAFSGLLLYVWHRHQQRIQNRLEAEVASRTATIRAQTEKLKEMDEVKTRLYTNITHEFRTPLTVISGMADLIKEDEKAQELIKRNANNLLDLVNQMLDLQKLESGHLKLDLMQGDIVRFVAYVSESFRSMGELKSQQFHFLEDPRSLVTDFDPNKLARVLSNLFSNAIKFTPEDGNIYLQLSKSADSQEVILRIRDTGIGIPADKLSDIFKRFYQVDDSATRAGEGTGIGLTIVSEYVKLMQGSIEVQSSPGLGTTFEIRLPISNDAPMGDPLRDNTSTVGAASPIRHSRLTRVNGIPPNSSSLESSVLVVEDNPDVIHYVGNSLKDHYQVTIAMNGEEGINKALDLVPDLIVSDVMMPIKDGFELCDLLKNDVRTSHIPIILLTAKADKKSRITGLSRGADVYLEKPFHKEELLVQMDNLIQTRRRLQKRYSTLDSLPTTDDPNIQMEDAFIKRMHDVLKENLSDETFDIAKLCDTLRISRSQLHNKLKAITGLSASHYIRQFRLAEAHTLLTERKELHISEIAHMVGFRDPKYFSKLFKEKFGMSPSEWPVK